MAAKDHFSAQVNKGEAACGAGSKTFHCPTSSLSLSLLQEIESVIMLVLIAADEHGRLHGFRCIPNIFYTCIYATRLSVTSLI